MRAIIAEEDVREGLEALVRLDTRLEALVDKAGAVPLRRRGADFAGLANIVVAQQVSVASAAAIFARLQARVVPLEAATLLRHDDASLVSVGLSRPKIRTLRAVAQAVADGLDLAALAQIEPEQAHAALCAIHGIGPWTADIFLLFCAGHPDIFPVGDLALREAVRDAFALEARPSARELAVMAEAWQPWRGVAARLFWAYYKTLRQGRETLPV